MIRGWTASSWRLGSRLDLAFGLGLIWLAEARLEAPVLSTGFQGGMLRDPAIPGRGTHGAGPGSTCSRGWTPQAREHPLAGVDKLGEAFSHRHGSSKLPGELANAVTTGANMTGPKLIFRKPPPDYVQMRRFS